MRRIAQNLWVLTEPHRTSGLLWVLGKEQAGLVLPLTNPWGALTQGCTHSRNDSIKMSIEKMVYQ